MPEEEKILIVEAPGILDVPANHAHLLIGLDNSLFFEFFEKYEAINFPKYRNIVENKMNQK